MDRRTFLGTLAVGLFAAPLVAEGQAAHKTYGPATCPSLGLTIPPSLLARADQVIE